MSIKHILYGFKRICGDTTNYGYVSDEVYQTWEECPICFEGYSKTFEPVVKEVKKALYLRDALNGGE
tara:strand:+ start:186 stop:386 length:201 start_codon:yes stop_codon:yes gene_type:complete